MTIFEEIQSSNAALVIKWLAQLDEDRPEWHP